MRNNVNAMFALKSLFSHSLETRQHLANSAEYLSSKLVCLASLTTYSLPCEMDLLPESN
jgi:hypothetical protein